MFTSILIISLLVAILAFLYPYLTASRFLGFAAYISARGGSSIYNTAFACKKYLDTPPPVPFKMTVDCVGVSGGILMQGIAAFFAGGKVEEVMVLTWQAMLG